MCSSDLVRCALPIFPRVLFHLTVCALPIKGLRSAEGFIRRELARTLNMRNTPEIQFILDQSIEYGVNMSKKIDEVTKDLNTEGDEDVESE